MTTTSSSITADDFHGSTKERSLKPLTNALSSGRISKEDYDLILRFVNMNQAFNHISLAQYNKVIFLLLGWRNHIGEFSKNDINDLAAGITKIQSAISIRGRTYSPETVGNFIRALKQFYNWLIDEGISDIPEKQIKKIKVPVSKVQKYKEDDVLSKEQISDLLAACKDLEEKTLISLLYEGALRIGEAATLTWNQVDIQKTHSRLNVTFKTKFPRRIPILLYKDYIQSWHNTSTVGPDNLVFTNRFGKLYKYHTIAKKIRIIGERAGIPHLQPHRLRHTRITHMILEGIPKETVSLICWGKINARELDRYAHLFEAVDDMYLKHYGLKQADGIRKEVLAPTVCPDCQYVNPPGSFFCFACHKALSKEALQAVDEFSKNVTPEMLQEAMALFLQKRMDETNS